MTSIKYNDFVRSLYRSSSVDNSESFKQVSIKRTLQVQTFSKKSAKRYGYSKQIAYPRYRRLGARHGRQRHLLAAPITVFNMFNMDYRIDRDT